MNKPYILQKKNKKYISKNKLRLLIIGNDCIVCQDNQRFFGFYERMRQIHSIFT